jgi:F0F1-type ATP synthase assembly protein I
MKKKLSPKQANSYLKYSGIGIQLIAIVLIFTYLGFWIDQHFAIQKPIFSILLAFLSVVLGIVLLMRQLLK